MTLKPETSSFFKMLQPQDSCLVLEDGEIFPGWTLQTRPSEKPAFGEIVFNTAMVGYQEVLTDPSYHQQIVVMTYPHQGNYGIRKADSEAASFEDKPIRVAGFIVHEMNFAPSNHASEQGILEFLKSQEIPYLFGVDTRKLTLHIRSKGALRGIIVPLEVARTIKDVKKTFETYPSFAGRDLILEITTKKPYWFSESGEKTIVALDFGVKTNLLKNLADRKAKVVVLPATSSLQEILSYKPNGVFLSNGPGDPAAASYAIQTVRQLLGKLPIFGVCMGHQILALALGAKTYKLNFGHRGINQPVLNHKTKSVEISSHNHGFAVDAKTLPANTIATHLALNDGVCEGIACPDLKAFSVQYHPESSPGPHDSEYLFDDFIRML